MAENFISYRRSETKTEAKNIYDELIRRGISTFLDFDTLQSGYFEEHIKEAIKTCNNFILVLTKTSFDRCVNSDDWLYKEINEALINKKNIVCVFVGEVVFPSNLLNEIESIRRHNAIKYEVEYFDNFIDRLISKFLVGHNHALEEKETFVVKDGVLIKYDGTLKEVNIPEGVISINDYVFKDKTNIKKIKFNSELKYIGEYAFERCKNLEYIILPKSLICIGKKAFSRCYKLAYVEVNDALETIEKEAFSFCNSLKQFTISKNVQKIDSSAFNNCCELSRFDLHIENKHFSIYNGILMNDSQTILIRCPENISLKAVTIPKSVTRIAAFAFFGCIKLSEISLPKKLLTVEACAFKNCTNIKHLELVASIKDFDISAIDTWPSNQKITYCEDLDSYIRTNIQQKQQTLLANDDPLESEEFVLIKTAFESEEEAIKISHMLLDRNLIVSGQLNKIKSIYVWDGYKDCQDEIELTCFTMAHLYKKVEEFVKTHHSYEVCEMVCIPIMNISKEFGNWIYQYVNKK